MATSDVYNQQDIMASTSSAYNATWTVAEKATTPSIPPGHLAILEMHANSHSNALIYVVVVLVLYVLGMAIVVIKYFRTERYEARLTRLFQDLVQRDRFFRLSRRQSSVPRCTPAPSTVIEDDIPQSPTFNLHENGQFEIESKL